MATPSSTATSPSPALSYALPARSSTSDTTTSSTTADDRDREQDLADREERRRKLRARTEFAKIARALRSSLALAGFKAKNNVMTVPFRALEERVRTASPANPTQSFHPLGSPSSFAAVSNGADKKRKASNTNYNSPLNFGASSSNMAMGLQSPYPSHPYASSSTAQGHPGPSNAAQSLFASILAPPPAKRARTIHNPEAPPIAAPLPPSQPTPRSSKKSSSKKGKEAAVASKGAEKSVAKSKKPAARSKQKGRERANSVSSTRTRSSLGGDTTEPVNDTDIKAAATLTEILFSRTGAAAAGSPRSSFSQSSVSSARNGTGAGALPLSKSSSVSSASATSNTTADAGNARAHARTNSSTSVASIRSAELQYQQQQQQHHPLATGNDSMDVDGSRRSMTPTATPRGSLSKATNQGLTSHSQPQSQSQLANAPGTRAVDTEAADLMLLLANSPSPARPTVQRDKDITRGVFAAGRVLFPSGETAVAGLKSESGSPQLAQSAPVGGSIRSPPRRTADPIVTPPTPRSADVSPLASPPSSQRTVIIASPSAPASQEKSGRMSLGGALLPPAPQTPAAFDMNDYINVSPSPAAVVSRSANSGSYLPLSQLSQTSSSSLGSASTSSFSFSQPQFSQQASQSQAPSSSQTTLAPSSASAPHLGASGRLRASGAVGVSSPLRKSVDASALNMGMGLNVGGRRLFESEAAAVAAVGVGAHTRAGPSALGSGIDLVRT